MTTGRSVQNTTVAIIGCGIAGISTAYYLTELGGIKDLLLIDADQPMSFTSAQSGDNYRNWWPHPLMVDFSNDSIDLMEQIARDSNNRLQMSRRGYAVATRCKDISSLIEELGTGYGSRSEIIIRIHERAESASYQKTISADQQLGLDGVDILQNQDLIRATFPSFAEDIESVIHIRRAGEISGQQMGQYMLEKIHERGGRRLFGRVTSIEQRDALNIIVYTPDDEITVQADHLVNAAGPFAGDIAVMLGVDLPIHNILQQKIAFDDVAGAIPRDLPFSIDYDDQLLDWSDEERELLSKDAETAWLTKQMLGATHCRPDGGDKGRWVKLGWAYNRTHDQASWSPDLDDYFPEIVLRAAARLNPSLKCYYGHLPRAMTHYGGWYSLTDENWPIIGPMGVQKTFVVGALSGFGTMVACAAGKTCAAWLLGGELPSYAEDLSLARYQNTALMQQLKTAENTGLL